MRARLVRIGPLVALTGIAAALCVAAALAVDERVETKAALAQRLAADSVDTMDAKLWTDVREFYRLRNGDPAWVDRQSAAAALAVLQSAAAHGLAPDAYGAPELRQTFDALDRRDDSSDRAMRLASLDVRLTGALLQLGHDVAVGRDRPELAGPEWKSRRTAPNLVSTLAQATTVDIARWVDAIRPPHAEYAALQRALATLRGQRQQGGWSHVDAPSLAPGRSHPAVAALQQRLAASGELKEPAASGAATPRTYDEGVKRAVRAFQSHHGLPETGIADGATIAAMNVPLETRIRQVELNLERWRRMPDDFGNRHFFVNIPSYRVVARESGKRALEVKAVVGKPGNETPIFSANMTTVVFSPYWNIPESILTKETAPAISNDVNYLTKNALEVVRVRKSGSAPVDPSTVDWSNPDELRQIIVRQRPGPRNALGHVKFLLPNSYDIYLHDTPSTRLFSRGNRAFSHGCVRVEDPEKLAQYVLRGDEGWNDPRIDRAMNSGTEQHVKLPEAIPVHIVYFTAWVDDAGDLHFGPDIYKYDQVDRGAGLVRTTTVVARRARP